jgi:LysR family transcriptional regulator, glycine cleavage system transcriptional activator
MEVSKTLQGEPALKRKMPPLNSLKAFEVAGTTGNFTRAAEVLNVTQSAVSRQVRQLEIQLGEQLLLRRHHHLQLTDAGRLLLRSLKQSFDKIELTIRDIRDRRHVDRLRVNAPPTFSGRWLLPRLSRLRDLHPDIEITLTSFPKDSLSGSGAIDCAIRWGDGEWSELDSTLLMRGRSIAVCSPSLLRASGDVPNFSQIPLLHVLSADGQRQRTWARWLEAAGITGVNIDAGYEFEQSDMAIRAAVDGLGIAIADRRMVARELEEGPLVQVLDVHVEGHQSYWFVMRSDPSPAKSLQAFRHWLQQEVDAADPTSAMLGRTKRLRRAKSI